MYQELNSFKDIKVIRKLTDSLNGVTYLIKYKEKESILKFYKSNEIERFKRETCAINLLNAVQFKYVPKIYFINNSNSFFIMSKIDGEKASPGNIFILNMANYIDNMQNYLADYNQKNILVAAEGVFSIRNHFKILKKRLFEFKKKINNLNYKFKNSSIINLINDKIEIDMDIYLESLIQNQLDIDKELENNKKIFSQSDIGIHNVLIKDSKIFTFDYEYAGLDDPAKTICDLLIHPDNLVKDDLLMSNLNFINSLNSFKNCLTRVLIILPIYRYKWFLIILNSLFKNINSNQYKSTDYEEKAISYLKNSEFIESTCMHNKKINPKIRN